MFVYVSGSSSTIAIYSFDPATGALTPRGSAAGGTEPTYLAWDPAGRFLFAGNGGSGRVTAFGIDRATGALSRINDAPTEGGGYAASVTHLCVDPTGRWVLTAHFDSGHVAVSPIAEDGAVGPPVEIQRPGPEAHQIVCDRSGRHVFVPCRSGNLVAQYRFDPGTGRLVPGAPAFVEAAPGAGPRHIAFHPSERFAYVINELDGTMTSYRYDAGAGTLSQPATVPTVPAGIGENAAAHVVVHPTGRFVYGSNRAHHSIAMFAVDPATGRLASLGHETGGGAINTPRDFAVDPSGRFLIAASMAADEVLVFRIDEARGTLRRIGEAVRAPREAQFVGFLEVR